MERRCVRSKNDDKELNMRLATWMVENPFNEAAKDCGGETRKMWLIRMFRENNILKKTNDAMSAKVQFLRKKYLAAKQWSETTGQAVLSSEGPSKFIEVLLKRCPWFYVMHGQVPTSMAEINSSFHNQSDNVQMQEDDDVLSVNSTGSIKFSFVREEEVESGLGGEANRNLESACSSPTSNVAVPKICFEELNGSFNIKKRKRASDDFGAGRSFSEMENEKMALREKDIACQLKRDELKYEYKRYKLAFREKNEQERRLHEKEMAQADIRKLELKIQLKKMEMDRTSSLEK